MKTKPILNGLTLGLTAVGIVFKTMHWPGASILLILAFCLLLLSLFTSLRLENKAQGMTVLESGALTGTFALLILGTMFRMQHWPGATILVALATACTLAIVLYAAYRQNRIQLGPQGTFTLLLFLVMLGGLLPNNAWVAVFNAN
jgi:hypothetical protein